MPQCVPPEASAGGSCSTLTDQGDAGLGPPLFDLKGMPAGYKAGRDRAIAKGWLWFHESGIA
jgi:hypothetical protein